jgi:hypothetical protein
MPSKAAPALVSARASTDKKITPKTKEAFKRGRALVGMASVRHTERTLLKRFQRLGLDSAPARSGALALAWAIAKRIETSTRTGW